MISVEQWCPITRQYQTMDFPLTKVEYDRAHAAWKAGLLIQDAFPMLDAGQREFLKTGMTPAVWNFVFGEKDDNA